MNEIKIPRGTTKLCRIILKRSNNTPLLLEDNERILFGVKLNSRINDSYLIFKAIQGSTPDGIYELKFDPGDTAALPDGAYKYDISLEHGTDLFPIIEESDFIITPTVTQWGDGK